MCELQKKYEKYNLFELLYLYNKSDITMDMDMDMDMNKKGIINNFVINEIDIDIDLVNDNQEKLIPILQSNLETVQTQKIYRESHLNTVQGNNIKWKLQSNYQKIFIKI